MDAQDGQDLFRVFRAFRGLNITPPLGQARSGLQRTLKRPVKRIFLNDCQNNTGC